MAVWPELALSVCVKYEELLIMSLSQNSSCWLAAFAPMCGFGFVPPVYPEGEDRRAREIRLRKQQSFEDLVRAAEERDAFKRTVQNNNDAALIAEKPKKRSWLKRAANRVLTALHLKKKKNKPASEAL
jgi:hypothetical protein